MHITIAERLHPYSHTPGTYVVLPSSSLRFQIFPTRLRICNISQTQPQVLIELPVPIHGPVKEFTVQLDLEKAAIHVWGHDAQEYFRYHIFPGSTPFDFLIKIDKGLTSWESSHIVSDISSRFPLWIDRLSLGNHKSQDWDMVKRRGNLEEIFPAWLRLGQLVENPSSVAYEGTATLLQTCLQTPRLQLYQAFRNLFDAAFEGILSPRLQDEQYQGFNLKPLTSDLSPLLLLTEGAKAIRSLFVRFQKDEICILAHLPPEFHCGRFLQIKCLDLGLLDLEWSKKCVRRMIFHSHMDKEIHFQFPEKIERYRLNGQFHKAEKVVRVQKYQSYIFDCFQK